MSLLEQDGKIAVKLVSSLESVSGILRTLDKTAFPQVLDTIQKVDDTITAVNNNPLLKRGVPERKETPAGGSRSRDTEF